MSHGHGEVVEVGPYAMVAEFENEYQLLEAAEAAKEAGYSKMDAYSPFPIHGLSEAIGFRDKKVPWIVFAGGLVGAFVGYSLQYYVSVFDNSFNVGGKPLNSLPAFVPITFECTILFASLGAFVGMLALNGLPKPYHSIFNTPGFERASQDRFFLAIETSDTSYESSKVRSFLQSFNPVAVSEVEA